MVRSENFPRRLECAPYRPSFRFRAAPFDTTPAKRVLPQDRTARGQGLSRKASAEEALFDCLHMNCFYINNSTCQKDTAIPVFISTDPIEEIQALAGGHAMPNTKRSIKTKLINEGLRYIGKDPMGNISKWIEWAKKIITSKEHAKYLEIFRKETENPYSNWHQLTKRFFEELSINTKNKFLTNYIINSGIIGIPTKNKLQERYDCNIPWAILIDPTSACNLKCIGCWAAEYEKTDSLSLGTLDRVIQEGKELGIYMYIYSGGEPLMRKDDLINLAKKHDDCAFLAFTNATLVDENFSKDLGQIGNFGLAISIEGTEQETDARRGIGVYKKAIKAMDLLKKEGVIFGFSTCYHKHNTCSVGSENYIDHMIAKGCMFGWYFTYIPIGKTASLDLLATPEQREYMFHQVRSFRKNKPIFLLDFWNDGDYVDGCIAGGKNYLHINARGDVEPCAFIHYSNININKTTLLEALHSPLFRQYREHQPFNENHLRPCPLLDNPEKLVHMVHQANAKSTQPIDEESVEALTSKTESAAKKWAPVANKLWENIKANRNY